ncbi:disease resistance protein RUN1-like isoform X2 [Rhodamnia argentea]|uniref:Disease resistance protein RUN1-like isoform X2 n=1 Tax=Rhodamnia argentea TaxID=178133 RepID=A0A8B8Q7U3_9MYRT|nr:disease resistance protein RUN1-like isoform X2 [Rhodamnia argentea]
MLDIGSFYLASLAILDLFWSGITQIWKGWSQMKMAKNLTVLNLTGYYYLQKTPNLSAHANLERLVLIECRNLVKIDKSIGQLKCLVSLDVRYCLELSRLPGELGELEALKELLLDSTPIKNIPEIQGMKNLRIISAHRCNEIAQLPLSIGGLASLEYLYLSGYLSLERLPDSIGKLKSLIEFDISRSGIKELPHSLQTIEKPEAIRGEFNCC